VRLPNIESDTEIGATNERFLSPVIKLAVLRTFVATGRRGQAGWSSTEKQMFARSQLRLATVLVALAVLPLVTSACKKKDDKNNDISYSAVLISIADAKAMFDAGTAVFVDARSSGSYAAGHIPGSININHSDTRVGGSGADSGLMLDDDTIFGVYSSRGADPRKTLICYDNMNAGATGSNASRIFWEFEFLGAPDGTARFLNGGLDAWISATFPTDTATPTPPDATLMAEIDAVWRTFTKRPDEEGTIDEILDALPGSNLPSATYSYVDSRTAGEYDGTAPGTNQGVGHMTGAVHVLQTECLDVDFRIKSPEDMIALAQSKGIDTTKRVFHYCTVGLRSSLTYVAFRSAGITGANFPGSMRAYFDAGGDFTTGTLPGP
jgi:thiosulfate/3-mercaptopyruvate sulfurtransferase